MSEFTCYHCKITYPKINNEKWNDFKAAEEMLILYPETKNDPTDTLCDHCNEEFKKWFDNLTDEDKKRMREVYK
jgi:protein-disulfide isomerase